METRARPTSRGRARCVSVRMGRRWEQTAAGPRAGACRLLRHALGDAALPRRGKGRCQCAGSTLFAPAGQKRFRVGAPDFGRVAGESCLRSALPIKNGWQARREDGSMPSCAPRGRRVPATIPRGDRRALPAPAQGINPLRIPFWGTATISPSAPVPQRRRRQVPARGPAAVYSNHRPNRNETKRPSPLLVGLGRVYTAPKALAGGTAALAALTYTSGGPCSACGEARAPCGSWARRGSPRRAL